MPLRLLAIATWIGSAVVLLLGFFTDLVEMQTVDPGYGTPRRFAAIWLFECGLAIGLGALATGLVYRATRKGALAYQRLLALCAGIVAPLVPLLLLMVARTWTAIPVALAWMAGSAVVVTCVFVTRRAPRPWVGCGLAVLVAVTWIPLILTNFRLAAAIGGVMSYRGDLGKALIYEPLTILFVLVFATSFIAVMTAVGVAMAARGRTVRDRLHRGKPHWRRTAIVCLIAVAIIGVEVSGLWGLSSGYIAGYWIMSWSWSWSWLHAIIVAIAIAFVAQRSWQRPLSPRGSVSTTVIVGVAALSGEIVFLATFGGVLLASAVRGEPLGFPVSEVPHFVLMWVALAALIPITLRKSLHGSLGQAVARIALLYLVPVLVPVTLVSLGVPVTITFWAKPSQVAICLTVLACGATLAGLVGRESPLSSIVASRLAIIPLVLVAGAFGLPELIAQPLTPFIAVAAALVALLWAMPPVAADVDRHAGTVLTASAQLLVVAAAGAIAAVRNEVQSDDQTTALLYFSIPLSALLCASVSSSRGAEGLSSPVNPKTPAPVGE